jgi:translation initiation factor 1
MNYHWRRGGTIDRAPRARSRRRTALMKPARNGPLKIVYTVGPDSPREVAKPAALATAAKSAARAGDVVKIRRETQGRRGKTVTTVSGITARPAVLAEIASALKQRCGAGGAVKDGVIEIQGDHREKAKDELEKRGYVVKFAGG